MIERATIHGWCHLFLALHQKAHVCMCVCVQSVLWLRAPMDKWLDSLSGSQTARVRIPLNVLFLFSFYFYFSLSIAPHLTLAIYWPGRTYAQPN